jgi:hypothetical protein
MTALLGIERALAGRLRAADFGVADREPDGDPEWIEYRHAGAAGKVLLGITHAPEARLIIAELWRPEQLAQARHGAGPERVAERYATWRYEAGDGPRAVEPEVATTVAAWLAGLGRPGRGRPAYLEFLCSQYPVSGGWIRPGGDGH